MSIKYLLKNLAIFLPGKYGYYKHINQLKDLSYNHEKDKHAVREKHHGGGGWAEEEKGGLRYRNYDSYDEYVTHQKQKFEEMIKLRGGFTRKELLSYRLKFYNRFKFLQNYINKNATILCVGARQGTEVEVLRDIGFVNAIGIDLNPGPDNLLVQQGDFMNLDFKDGSIDLIYSNCLDHAFDIDKFIGEQYRVLKPGGYALYDVAIMENGGSFEAVEWESEDVIVKKLLNTYGCITKLETESAWKWVLLQK